jgi:hypothetical protein
MEPVPSIESSGNWQLEEYAVRMRRTFQDSFERYARGAVRLTIGNTPPSDGVYREGGLVKADQVRGSRAVDRDLNKIFVPVKLKGKRRERISGAQMVQIHLKHLRYKRVGAVMRRYGGPYYVDARKFNQLAVKLVSHVGRLASGWLPAAMAVGTPVPAWVSRHGLGRGAVRYHVTGSDFSLMAANLTPNIPGHLVSLLQSRTDKAGAKQMQIMQRELPPKMLSEARTLGFLTL